VLVLVLVLVLEHEYEGGCEGRDALHAVVAG
jgi:hypothetical protein